MGIGGSAPQARACMRGETPRRAAICPPRAKVNRRQRRSGLLTWLRAAALVFGVGAVLAQNAAPAPAADKPAHRPRIGLVLPGAARVVAATGSPRWPWTTPPAPPGAAAIPRHRRPAPGLARVAIEGTTRTNPDRLLAMLENKPGDAFEIERAERDARRLAAGDRVRWTEDALRARVVFDQFDFAVFPRSGYRALAQVWAGRRSGDLSGPFNRLEAEGDWVSSLGADTLALYARVQSAGRQPGNGVDRYALGGFQQLSGYQRDQLTGNQLLLRLGWYRRLSPTQGLTRGYFIGGTLEAGNTWARSADISLARLRAGMSLYLAMDSGLGPFDVALTHAPQDLTGITLVLGRP